MKNNHLILLLISKFSGDFLIIAPYIAIYFSTLGMPLEHISLLFFIWSLSVIVFEIPTGILADHFQKKYVVILARLIKMSVFFVWLLFPTFIGIACGFILWGLATAFDSGAFQAYVYELLQEENNEDKFAKILGYLSGANFIGLFIAALTAGLLVTVYGYSVLLVGTAVSVFISALVLLPLPCGMQKNETILQKDISLIKTFKKTIVIVSKKRFLLLLLTIGILVGGVKGSLEEFNPLLLEMKHLPILLIGFFIAGIELIKTAGSFLGGHVTFLKNHQITAMAIIGVSLVGAGLLDSFIYVIVALSFLTFIDALLWISNDAEIQKHAENSNRSTVLSFKNFGVEFIGLAVFGLITFTGQWISLPTVYSVGGMVLILASMALFLIEKKQPNV